MMRIGCILLCGLLLAGTIAAQSDVPAQLRDVGIDQRLGEKVPLDLHFRDEEGRDVRLGDYFGKKPVVLTLVYYECPMLCTMVLNGTVRAMRAMELNAGKDFEVVTLSFDPGETPEMAEAKKEQYVSEYGRDGAAAGWHFLTGEEDQIRALADAAGFRYKYDPEIDQYIHASGIMVLTPDGELARYLYGVEYSARDLRLSLIDASAGDIGSAVDAVLLYCFHYDPSTGKYGLVIMRVIRVFGAATLLALVGFVTIMLRRDRKEVPGRP